MLSKESRYVFNIRDNQCFYLDTQNAKDNKEGTADQHNVPDGPQGCYECFHYKLKSWSSANHPVY